MQEKRHELMLTYRGKEFDHFKLTASRIIANVTKEKLSEILSGIYDVWQEKKDQGFVKHCDCEHLCLNYREYQNLLYQIGFLDKIKRGEYVITSDGEKVARGEPFCKHILISLLRLVKEKKEDDRHALLLLWFYHQASVITGKRPESENFRKMNDEIDSTYPITRREVGKTMMKIVQSCTEETSFFDEWEKLLGH